MKYRSTHISSQYDFVCLNNIWFIFLIKIYNVYITLLNSFFNIASGTYSDYRSPLNRIRFYVRGRWIGIYLWELHKCRFSFGRSYQVFCTKRYIDLEEGYRRSDGTLFGICGNNGVRSSAVVEEDDWRCFGSLAVHCGYWSNQNIFRFPCKMSICKFLARRLESSWFPCNSAAEWNFAAVDKNSNATNCSMNNHVVLQKHRKFAKLFSVQ